MNTGLSQRNIRRSRGADPDPRECEATRRRNRAAELRLQPDGHRVQAKAEAIKEALRGCAGRELEMLIRYYVCGQDIDKVAAEMGATCDELTGLAARLRRIARQRTSRGMAAAR